MPQVKRASFSMTKRPVKAGAKNDGAFYIGTPLTPGFTQVRQAGESISVMFILENGAIAYGDCAAVQYSGAGGRDPLFLAKDFIPVIEKEIAPLYEGKEITSFREMADLVDKAISPSTGKIYHTAIRYGVTQACLDAVAKSQSKLMAQVVAMSMAQRYQRDYSYLLSIRRRPLFECRQDDNEVC